MGSRYDGVCLRQPGIGRSHGPVRPSCLGRARGNRVAEARGKLRRDGRSDGRGQSDRQRGDGQKLVRRWLGAVPSCIGRPAWLRVPKGFLRAARGPRRRARGGACAASCRVFCQVVIGQCGVSFPSEKAVGFSPVRNWPVIARVLLFHCIRA